MLIIWDGWDCFWQRKSEGLIGEMAVLNRDLFLHLFYNDSIFSLTLNWKPTSQKSTAVNGVKNITYSLQIRVLFLPFFTGIGKEGLAWIQASGHLCRVIQVVCCFSTAARLKPEPHCHFLSNHSLCSLQGSIGENCIWPLRSAPLLHSVCHYEPKNEEGQLLFTFKTAFF